MCHAETLQLIETKNVFDDGARMRHLADYRVSKFPAHFFRTLDFIYWTYFYTE